MHYVRLYSDEETRWVNMGVREHFLAGYHGYAAWRCLDQ